MTELKYPLREIKSQYIVKKNPPEIQVTSLSGRKLGTEFIYTKNFCAIFLNIFSTEIIPTNTKCRKQVLKFIWNNWISGEMKLLMKFYPCACTIFLSSELILSSSLRKLFWCYFRLLFISLAFIKCKKDSNILKILPVQGFSPLKTEIVRFPIRFRLSLLHRKTIAVASLGRVGCVGRLATPFWRILQKKRKKMKRLRTLWQK